MIVKLLNYGRKKICRPSILDIDTTIKFSGHLAEDFQGGEVEGYSLARTLK